MDAKLKKPNNYLKPYNLRAKYKGMIFNGFKVLTVLNNAKHKLFTVTLELVSLSMHQSGAHVNSDLVTSLY